MVVMGREFKKTFLRLSALPAVLLLVSPLGSGGAIGILSSIAKDYGVSGNQVAWTNGLMGGVLTFAGAIAMALMPARFDIRMAYAVTGFLNAGVLGVFCFGTPRPWMYIVGSALFLFTVGACWAMYSALVLKIVGASGAQRLRTIRDGREPGKPAGGLHGGAGWVGREVVRAQGIAGDGYGGERRCIAGISCLVLVGAGQRFRNRTWAGG